MERPLLILMVCSTLRVNAQDSCACSRNLDRYMELVTFNYAGFKDKVTSTTLPTYNVLVDTLWSKAASTNDKTACYRLLDTYRAFFQDKHLQLEGAFMHGDDKGVPNESPVSTSWTAATLKVHFEERGGQLRTLEGLWSMDAYEVGIVFDATTAGYQAVIMKSGNANWKEGMVKFTCPEPVSVQADVPVHYWRGDLGMVEAHARFIEDHFVMQGIGTWRKTFPVPSSTLDERTFNLTYGSEVQWRLLDDSTLYIKLGSCQLSNKAVLDSLVKANKEALDRIPNWIVDFCGNGGGSTDVFQSLLPYLYTKPFKEYGVNHWMSPVNTAALKDFLVQNEKMLHPGSARSIGKWVEQGEEHPNTWHIGHGETTRLKKHDMPQRVAILADKGTASSGESFLEIARGMSDKSVIFGENTGGFMDYGDVMPHDLGCDGLVASVPTSRMNRIDHGLAYDKDGIAPDVRIAPDVTDWIAFVQAYWRDLR